MNTEKALSILPIVGEIFDKVDLKKLTVKSKDEMGAGLEGFTYVLKNATKIQDELIEIVAILEDSTIEEVRKQPFTKTIKTIKDSISAEDIDFFRSAM